jgi:hypothetical protein
VVMEPGITTPPEDSARPVKLRMTAKGVTVLHLTGPPKAGTSATKKHHKTPGGRTMMTRTPGANTKMKADKLAKHSPRGRLDDDPDTRRGGHAGMRGPTFDDDDPDRGGNDIYDTDQASQMHRRPWSAEVHDDWSTRSDDGSSVRGTRGPTCLEAMLECGAEDDLDEQSSSCYGYADGSTGETHTPTPGRACPCG